MHLQDIESRIAQMVALRESFKNDVSIKETELANLQNELSNSRSKWVQVQAVLNELEHARESMVANSSALETGKMVFSGFYIGMPGWCNVNRDMMRHFIKSGIDMKLDPYFTQYTVNDVTSLDEAFFNTLIKRGMTDRSIYFNSAIPHLLKPYAPNSYKIAYSMFESAETCPDQYRDILNMYNEVWVPSQQCKKIFSNCGVKRDIHVHPLGVNLDMFSPAAKNHTEYTFGFIGWFTYRKRIDILLRAYISEFTGDDNVNLVIKPYYPGSGDPTEDIQKVIDDNKEFAKDANNLPEFTIVNKIVSVDKMADYYNSIDALVCTSMGEGFYAPGLEAMACGKLLIHPKAIGIEYVNDSNSFPYDCTSKVVGDDKISELCAFYNGLEFWAPSWESWAEKMRFC